MSRRRGQNHCITFTLHSIGTTTKVLVVHSLCPLSPAAKEGEDDDFGGSNNPGNVKERRFANCHSLIPFAKEILALKIWSCGEFNANLNFFFNIWSVSSVGRVWC